MIRLLILGVLLSLSGELLALDKLRILLTNDDGYKAPGIKAVRTALVEAGHDVVLIAPATQQSGASSSVTSGGISFTEEEPGVWAVTGRPADAVRIGLGHIMKDNPPDLVVSGANFGNNSGVDVMISGTVGAALTALQFGVPAIAVSVEIKYAEIAERFPGTFKAFPGAGKFIADLINEMNGLERNGILNVNYPALPPEEIKGVRWAELSSHSILSTDWYEDEDGTWSAGLNPAPSNERGTDAFLMARGYITLTLLDRDIAAPSKRKHRKLANDLDKLFD